jgi:hypothetical protein
MPERGDRLEGWGVRPGWAVVLAGGFFAFILAAVGGLFLFYRAEAGDALRAPRPSAFPAPALVTTQRSPEPLARPAPAAPDDDAWRGRLEAAMNALAAEGERGWEPVRPAKAGR